MPYRLRLNGTQLLLKKWYWLCFDSGIRVFYEFTQLLVRAHPASLAVLRTEAYAGLAGRSGNSVVRLIAHKTPLLHQHRNPTKLTHALKRYFAW